jgi:uncharacterized integral membrane protein
MEKGGGISMDALTYSIIKVIIVIILLVFIIGEISG